jgi:hypothetical protein
VGHVRRSAGKHGQVLFSNFGRRLGIQAKVRRCVARASCRQRALTGVGPTRSFCQRGSVNAAAGTKRFTSSARICRYAAGGTPSFMTASGFTFTASPTQRMPINSCKGSAGKNSTRNNEGRAAIGRVGISLKLPTYSRCVVAFVCRRTIQKSKSS